jgi:hypothetical protein
MDGTYENCYKEQIQNKQLFSRDSVIYTRNKAIKQSHHHIAKYMLRHWQSFGFL